jgi:hypothetical protein
MRAATVRAKALVRSNVDGLFSGTITWSPRDPEVLGKARRPFSSRRDRRRRATRHATARPAGGPGSRSNTITSGRSGSRWSARNGWSSTAAWLAAQASDAASSIRQYS